MRKNSQRLFKHIQFLGSVTVLYIQIIVRVIVKGNSNKKPALVAHWVSIGNLECCCLNSNALLYTYMHIYIYIYIYIYILC